MIVDYNNNFIDILEFVVQHEIKPDVIDFEATELEKLSMGQCDHLDHSMVVKASLKIEAIKNRE